jgi:hypothetical protein
MSSNQGEIWKLLHRNEKEELVETLTAQGRHLRLENLVDVSRCVSLRHLDGKCAPTLARMFIHRARKNSGFF